MIGIAMEIPTSLLERLSPKCNLDFALAHRVLEDEEYARFYAKRATWRELILDNSMHELGEALPMGDVVDAAKKVRANYLISPDRLEDADWTFEQYRHIRMKVPANIGLAVVMAGRTPDERREFLFSLGPDVDMLCMPYRAARLEWYIEQRPRFSRIHLLGASSLQEASGWAWLNRMLIGKHWTLDTSKPIKAALVGRRLNDGKSLRGIPISSKDLLGLTEFTSEQLCLMEDNLQILRDTLS